MNQDYHSQCAKCPIPLPHRACFTPDGKGPAFCPTLRHKDMTKEAFDTSDEEEHRLICASIQQEASGFTNYEEGYEKLIPIKPRIVEIIDFCHRMGYKRLGLIFCMGSRAEAKIVEDILTVNSFEVVSVTCKVGQIAKTQYGISLDDLVNKNNIHESTCNPKLQAMIANDAKVDFAILLNLCVGHDSLVIKYLEAPVTVFSVKDRLLGHYPLMAIYQYDTYYRYLKHPLPVCGIPTGTTTKDTK